MLLEVGKIVKGVVTRVTDFGAFVALDGEKTGLVHISEVSTEYVKDVKAYLKEKQEVEAIVISIDNGGRIGLSIKRLLEQRIATQPPDEYVSTNNPSESFEDMMSKFKTSSDERMSDLKRSVEGKRGGSSRRGGR